MACAGVETIELGKKFEAIVAADVIEYLKPASSNEVCPITPLRRLMANPEPASRLAQKVLDRLIGKHRREIADVAYIGLWYHTPGFKWLVVPSIDEK